MELRPRRGRSAQPPSTPTIAKPSPRLAPQSSSRKKPPPVPPTPILIPSDDEDAHPQEIHADAAPKEIHTDSVAAAPIENGDESALKQDNQDIILPDSSEFETPLSSIIKLRRAQNKLASSNVKSKIKVTSSVKKKKTVEELGSTPVVDTHMEGEACIANDRVTAAAEKVGLDEATKKVYGVPNGEIALEETEKRVLTGSVPQNSDELAVEINVTVCSKNTEVLSPSSKSKKVHSSKKKSPKKRDEDNEVVDTKLHQVDVQEHIIDVDAPIVRESQVFSLILSDDETGQVLDVVQVEGCEGTISASKEAALEKCSPVAEVSKVSSTGKKSRSNKKGIMKEQNLSRKLFEETSITIPSSDTEEDHIMHGLGWIANSSKEGARKIDTVEVEKCAERVSSTSKRHNFKSPSRSLKEREVADLEMFDSDGDKRDASDTGVEGKDIVNDLVQEVSEESSDEAVSSSDERDEDSSNDHDKLNAATSSSQKNAVDVEKCSSSDDDGGNASSGNDDDDEDEMASVFFSSMKAHLQRISEPSCSGLSMQKGRQAKQEALGRTDSQFTKSAGKESCANGGLTGHGLLWCPEVVLSSSKISKAQAGKPQSVVEASRNSIWGRDRCLQDGLCVRPVDPIKLNKLARKQKDDTAGVKWFNLSAPTITPELKKELQLLKLRGALDPKRHYKAEDSKGLPKYFQVGTVVGGPADFYSGRLTKKEQKSSLASELLSDSSLTAFRKRKFTEIQDQKQAGGKGFWKKKKSKRTPAWAKI